MKIKVLRSIRGLRIGEILEVASIDGTVPVDFVPTGGLKNGEYGYRADQLVANGIAIEYAE